MYTRTVFLVLFLLCPFFSHAYTADDFVITVDTARPGTASNVFRLPTTGSGYNAVVDWGDGSTTTLSGTPGNVNHTYAAPGTYEIVVTPNVPTGFPRIYFNNAGDRQKILTVEQWGTGQWTSMQRAFYGCLNLTVEASDAPNLSNVTDMSFMFGNTLINSDISSWDVSNVTNMSGLFFIATAFNQPLNAWNMTGVTNTSQMFYGAIAFNQPLNAWDMSSVTTLQSMFANAESFNQDISAWDVSSVTNMSSVFYGAIAFNQPLNAWNMTGVTNTSQMFSAATSFNQPLNTWDVSSVTDMQYMFSGATSFNQPLNTWDVSAVTNFYGLFSGSAFNQDLSAWNVDPSTGVSSMLGSTQFNQDISGWTWLYNPARTSWSGLFANATAFNQPVSTLPSNITDLSSLFSGATAFNQPLSSWDVSNVTSMSYMFQGATAFNQPIGSWNVSSVTGSGMISLFEGATAFNQDISSWDVSGVTSMASVFKDATSFNQPLNTWNVSAVTDMGTGYYNNGMFQGATAFNQPLDQWDVSNVITFGSMFQGASSFDQDLSNWDMSGVVPTYGEGSGSMFVFEDSALSRTNYTKILTGWSLLTPNIGLDLGTIGVTSNPTTYCDTAQAARDLLTGTYSWSITDGGPADCTVVQVESSNGSQSTDVSVRAEKLATETASSTPIATTVDKFVSDVRKFLDYLTHNEEDLDNLSPEERTSIIVSLRDILAFLLKLLPAF